MPKNNCQRIVAHLCDNENQAGSQRGEPGEPYGTIADEAGVSEAIKAKMLQIRKKVIITRVEEGRMTQEPADKIIPAVENAPQNDGWEHTLIKTGKPHTGHHNLVVCAVAAQQSEASDRHKQPDENIKISI